MMKDYTIPCTEEQTKKALELGAPIEYAKVIDTINENSIRIPEETGEFYLIPTAEEMIGWLEDKGIWIHFCKPNRRPTLLSYSVSNISEPFRRVFIGREYKSRKEVTLAAITDALDYLEKEMN